MVDEIKAEEKDKISEAREIAERIEKATSDLKLENDRFEKMRSNEIISGRSLGKQPIIELTPEEKVKQETKDFFKGGALDKYL